MAEVEAGPEVDRRGAIEIELEGVAYGLQPSFEAIEAIERKCRTLGELVTMLNANRLPIADMGVVTAELMRAYGTAHPEDPNVATYRGANPKRLAELIYEEAASRVRGILFVVLASAMTGGYHASGEAKPATETGGTPDAGN